MKTCAAISLLLALLAADAAAQGIILDSVVVDPITRPQRIRRNPVRLESHDVRITITDQVARTEVTQVFRNPSRRPVEGVYLFPLPKGAVISDFTMSMGGKQVQGEILDARTARRIYMSIVHRRQDPGLLEYAGRRLIRARIFPIPPRGETKVTLRLTQLLEPDAGLLELRYPLRSSKFAPGPVRISGHLDVTAKAGVATLFSPTHKLDVVRKNENHVLASFEELRSAADRDLRVMYTFGRKDFGLALTTHKPKGEDGYFLMLVSPNAAAQEGEVLPKDVVFVLDTSGSMGDRNGKKMRQAKAAVGYALGRLDARDRFNVIAFATEARLFRDGLVEATKDNVSAALAHVDSLQATGGTAIHAALTAAMNMPRAEGRVRQVIFLTDGQPTIGPTDNESILAAVAKANTTQARLFVFGVGDEVNATLLTALADNHRGADAFVAESENIEIKVSAFYDKVASPVLTDVKIDIANVSEYDVYPRRLGDLFKGQQVMIVGRYKAKGPRAVMLRGRIGARELNFVYEGTFGDTADHAYLPRLWAVRKVGFLMGEIRRNGESAEVVQEIKKLGIRHGIVTPYTSFLVTEERELRRRPGTPMPATWGGSEGESADAGLKSSSGKGAVGGARIEAALSEADDASIGGMGVKTVDGRTFRLKDGVWTDIDMDKRPDAEVVRVKYLSEEYSALLEDEQLMRLLSVGKRMRFSYGGKIYEISTDG